MLYVESSAGCYKRFACPPRSTNSPTRELSGSVVLNEETSWLRKLHRFQDLKQRSLFFHDGCRLHVVFHFLGLELHCANKATGRAKQHHHKGIDYGLSWLSGYHRVEVYTDAVAQMMVMLRLVAYTPQTGAAPGCVHGVGRRGSCGALLLFAAA